MASSDELFRQGMALFQAGNLPAAEAAVRKLARRERRHPLVLGVFGAILVALKKSADAEPVLREAVRINPASHPALYNLGLALKALGRPDEALARFSEALAVNALLTFARETVPSPGVAAGCVWARSDRTIT